MAAGKGERLEGLTENIPKALIELNNKALLSHVINMARYIDVDKIIIIGGSRHELLKNYLKDLNNEIILIENKQFCWGNLHTLNKAIDYIEDDFLLFNVDHVFSRKILSNFLANKDQYKNIISFCDENELADDQMRIKTRGSNLQVMAKYLESWDTGYIGLTYCPKLMLDSYKDACLKVLDIKQESAFVEDVLNYLSQNNFDIQCLDIDNELWFEVDTKKDLDMAEKIMKNNRNSFL